MDNKTYQREWYQKNKARLTEGYKKRPRAPINARRRAAYAEDSSKLSAYNKAWRTANPGKQRQYWRKAVYGLSEGQQKELFSHPCGICGGAPKVVDHDHITGQVRGALCAKCNTGIGLLGDNLAGVERAVAYLANVRK